MASGAWGRACACYRTRRSAINLGVRNTMKIEYEVMVVGKSIYANEDKSHADGFESEEKAQEWIANRIAKWPKDFPAQVPVYYIRKLYKAG